MLNTGTVVVPNREMAEEKIVAPLEKDYSCGNAER